MSGRKQKCVWLYFDRLKLWGKQDVRQCARNMPKKYIRTYHRFNKNNGSKKQQHHLLLPSSPKNYDINYVHKLKMPRLFFIFKVILPFYLAYVSTIFKDYHL